MGKTSGDRKRHMRVLLLAVLPEEGALPAIGDSGPINGLALTHCAVVGSD